MAVAVVRAHGAAIVLGACHREVRKQLILCMDVRSMTAPGGDSGQNQRNGLPRAGVHWHAVCNGGSAAVQWASGPALKRAPKLFWPLGQGYEYGRAGGR